MLTRAQKAIHNAKKVSAEANNSVAYFQRVVNGESDLNEAINAIEHSIDPNASIMALKFVTLK